MCHVIIFIYHIQKSFALQSSHAMLRSPLALPTGG
jgi:hypothetical protein